MTGPFGAYVTMLRRTVVTRGRALGLAAAGLALVAIAGFVSVQGLIDPTQTALDLANALGLSLLVPVAALVVGGATLGDPADDATLVYLWLRPQPRWKLALAADLVGVAVVIAVSVVPTVVAAAIIRPEAAVVGGVALSATLAAVAYTALFTWLGLLTRRALVWGIAYVSIGEQFVARGGSGLGFLSVHAHAVSVLAGVSDRRVTLDYFSTSTAAVTMVVAAGLAALATTRRLVSADVA